MAIMNNTKINKRISEIDITRFVMKKINENGGGVKFKMGMNDNLLWYKPMFNSNVDLFSDYVFDEETLEELKDEYIPTSVVIGDFALSSNLDFIKGVANVGVNFLIPVNAYVESEIIRHTIESIRDSLRQGYFVYDVVQRSYDMSATPTTFPFKISTDTSAITYSSTMETTNGFRYIEVGMNIDLIFSDLLVFGNQYLLEMAIKTGENTYSDYERIYQMNTSFGVVNNIKSKQVMKINYPRSYQTANVNDYNNATSKYDAPLGVYIQQVDLGKLSIGTVIKTSSLPVPNWVINTGTSTVLPCNDDQCPPINNNHEIGFICSCGGNRYEYMGLESKNINYYRVISTTIDDWEEQKSWEATSIWESKAFSFTLDLFYRDKLESETTYIIGKIYDDLMQKRFGYNIYKVKLSKYNLVSDETWELDKVEFERYFLLTSNETAIELGENLPMTGTFVVSDLK